MIGDDDVAWSVEDNLSLHFSCLAHPEKKSRVGEVTFSTKMNFNGYTYAKKSTATNFGHAFYQCSQRTLDKPRMWSGESNLDVLIQL